MNAIMTIRKAFTLIELLVVISIMALLMSILLPALSRAREVGKRSVCLSDLKQLTIAWSMYAGDNGGRLVNGAPVAPPSSEDFTAPASYGCVCPPTATNRNYRACAPSKQTQDPLFWPWHQNELPWVGPARGNLASFYSWDSAPVECQKAAIETGALWKYVRQHKIYNCPNGRKGELVAFNIFDSMNGEWKYRTTDGSESSPVKALCYKTLDKIKKTWERALFIDEGRPTADSYAVNYSRLAWFDFPPVRHGDGTTVSFADGHASYWKWKARETIQYGREYDTSSSVSPGYVPTSCAGKNDLYKVQIACWGKVEYTLPADCILGADL